ncbi:MAG: hypothetical protein WAZ18_02060 [Alphaproteobacteria bacterium]
MHAHRRLKLEHIRVAQTLGDEGKGTAFLLKTPRNWPHNIVVMPLHSLDVSMWHDFKKNPSIDYHITLADPNGHEAQARLAYVPPSIRIPRKPKHAYLGSLYHPTADVAFVQIEGAERDFSLHRFQLKPAPAQQLSGIIGYADGTYRCGWGKLTLSTDEGDVLACDKKLAKRGVSGAPLTSPHALEAWGFAIETFYKKQTGLLRFLESCTIIARPRFERSPRNLSNITARPVPLVPTHHQTYAALEWNETPSTRA